MEGWVDGWIDGWVDECSYYVMVEGWRDGDI